MRQHKKTEFSDTLCTYLPLDQSQNEKKDIQVTATYHESLKTPLQVLLINVIMETCELPSLF